MPEVKRELTPDLDRYWVYVPQCGWIALTALTLWNRGGGRFEIPEGRWPIAAGMVPSSSDDPTFYLWFEGPSIIYFGTRHVIYIPDAIDTEAAK